MVVGKKSRVKGEGGLYQIIHDLTVLERELSVSLVSEFTICVGSLQSADFFYSTTTTLITS